MNRRARDQSHTSGAGSRPQAILDEGREQAREAANIGREQLQAGAGRAADGVGDFAEAIGSAANRLSELHHEGLADYANRLASQLNDVSGRLRSKNVDELAGDVRQLAERNPALFLLGSVAIGIGLSRFAKASREQHRTDSAGGEPEWSQRSTSGEATMADYTGRNRVFADGAAEQPSTDAERSDRPTTPDSTGGTGL